MSSMRCRPNTSSESSDDVDAEGFRTIRGYRRRRHAKEAQRLESDSRESSDYTDAEGLRRIRGYHRRRHAKEAQRLESDSSESSDCTDAEGFRRIRGYRRRRHAKEAQRLGSDSSESSDYTDAAGFRRVGADGRRQHVKEAQRRGSSGVVRRRRHRGCEAAIEVDSLESASSRPFLTPNYGSSGYGPLTAIEVDSLESASSRPFLTPNNGSSGYGPLHSTAVVDSGLRPREMPPQSSSACSWAELPAVDASSIVGGARRDSAVSSGTRKSEGDEAKKRLGEPFNWLMLPRKK
ncbi:hypothetical protein MTO96_006698 [Rhipicephalus appendiculatus]